MERLKTPEDLEAKAKMLLEKAMKMQNARYIKIGKLVESFEKNDFQKFNLESFKHEVSGILKS